MQIKKYVEIIYNEVDKPITDYPLKLIKHIIDKFSVIQNSIILEMGCGRGEFLNQFHLQGMNAHGIDISDKAKQKYPHLNIKTFDALNDPFPFADNSIDIIYSKSFIEHFHFPEKIMSEAYRVLKNGGKIITLTPEWDYNYKNFYEDYTHRTPFTKISLTDIHKLTNFKDIEVESFRQLPFLWNKPKYLKSLLVFLCEVTRLIAPDVFRKKNVKWIRWSKEVMIMSYAKK